MTITTAPTTDDYSIRSYLLAGAALAPVADRILASIRTEITTNAGDNESCLYKGVYAKCDGTSSASRVAFHAIGTWNIGMYVDSSVTCGISSYGKFNETIRSNGYSASAPVLKVDNQDTTDGQCALWAKIAKVTAGQYAVKLENTAQSSVTEGTKNHIGFTAAKTNVRNMPLDAGISDETGGSPKHWYGLVGLGDLNDLWWYSNAIVNDARWAYPLNLPHGCTVTKIRIQQYGGGGTATGTSRPYVGLSSATWSDPSKIIYESGAYATTTNETETIVANMSITIDNVNKRYFVLYRNVVSGATGYNYIYALEVTYTIQDLGAAPGF
jgi:hypothetical protein